MKNGKRLLLALAFALPSTFVFKGQDTSYANEMIRTYKDITNSNQKLVKTITREDGSYVRLPQRTINERGLQREDKGEIYPSKFNADDLPYEGHATTVDYKELNTEIADLLTSSKTKLINEGKTTYYMGGERTYSKEKISDDIKAVDSTISVPLDGFTYPLGLFAAPGEAVTLLIPIEYEDQLFVDSIDSLSINVGVTARTVNQTGGLEGIRSNNASQPNYNTQSFYQRTTRFSSNEIFKKENTIVKDGKRYFAGKVASPLGGPIYVQSNYSANINIPIRATGALESRLYILGSTTDEDNEDNFNNAKAPYFDMVSPSMRFSGELSSIARFSPDNLKNISTFIEQQQSINYFLNNQYGRQVFLEDRYWEYVVSLDNYATFNKYSYDMNYVNHMISSNDMTDYKINFNSQYHVINGENVRWGLKYFMSGANNMYHLAVMGMQDSLITNIAKGRKDVKIPLSSQNASMTDPYSNLRFVWNSRFIDKATSFENQSLYLSLFHSTGIGLMSKMQEFAWNSAQWNQDKNKITNADTVLRGLSYYSGFNFTDFTENTIRASVSEEVKNEIKNKICNTSDGSTMPCNYPTFAATASLYTKSNERVKDLEQWRKDIDSNIAKNNIPSYFSDSQALESIKNTANYKEANQYQLKDGVASKEDSDANVYKRNLTGSNFKIDAFKSSTLNLKPTFTNTNSIYDLDGRIASTADIKEVKLEWQEGNAISDNGDNTYTVDPNKFSADTSTYNFAISVVYNDSSIPSEILYGTLEKDMNSIQVQHYSAKGLTEDTTKLASPFDQFDYNTDKLTQTQEELGTETSNGSEFNQQNVNDKSNGVISFINFDLHLPAGEFWVGISPLNAKAVLVETQADGTKNVLANRSAGAPFTNESIGDHEFNFDKPTTVTLSLILYTRANQTQNGTIYIGHKQGQDWPKLNPSLMTRVGSDVVPGTENNVIKDIPFQGNKYESNNNSYSDQQFSKNDMSLISYGFFNQGHVVNDDTQDTKAFKDQNFTKYNKYDKNLSDSDKNTLIQTEKTISDKLYLTGQTKATALKYENMDDNYGALYFTYENVKGNNINQVILRDEQNSENNKNDYITETLNGTIGDVSIYVGDKLDEKGSPLLSEFTKVKTDINNETWTVKNNTVAEYFARSKASNRIIDLDKSYNNKYILVKVENGQTNDGKKSGSFKIAEIEFHSTTSLGDTSTSVALNDENIKRYGTWQEVTDINSVTKTALVGSEKAYLGFRFTGSVLSISANKFSTSGKIKITIDGNAYEIDTKADIDAADSVIFNTSLDNKEHLVTLEVIEGEVSLTRLRFDSNSFGTVSEKEIKDQVGIKDDSDNPTNPENPSEPNEPTVPENPSSGNNNTNVIILATTFSILGAILIALAVVLIVEHNKRKKNKEVK